MANTKAHISFANLSRAMGNMKDKVVAGLAKKVDKVEGYGLSKNDFTDALLTKLNGVEEGAQVNVVEAVSVKNETIVTMDGKTAVIDMSAFAKSADLASAYIFRGTVANYSDLPTEGLKAGDVYNITNADAAHNINAGDNVAWTGTEWDNLAGIVDLSGKVDKVEGESLIADTEIARLAKMSDEANKTEVSAESFTAGTKVATITIDGTATEINVPTVAATAEYTEGTKLSTVTINGTALDIYAPSLDFATDDDIDSITADWDL